MIMYPPYKTHKVLDILMVLMLFWELYQRSFESKECREEVCNKMKNQALAVKNCAKEKFNSAYNKIYEIGKEHGREIG